MKTVHTGASRDWTDGVIFLRPHRVEDAAAHLAGEDDEMARWLSGGRSTVATVEAYIDRNLESWRSGGPRRVFGVFDCTTGKLIGNIEANLARTLEPDQVNVSYGIHKEWRGRGLAQRAVNLMREYLQANTTVRQIVLRISPANLASLRVAEKIGCAFLGVFDEVEGPMARYVKDVT